MTISAPGQVMESSHTDVSTTTPGGQAVIAPHDWRQLVSAPYGGYHGYLHKHDTDVKSREPNPLQTTH